MNRRNRNVVVSALFTAMLAASPVHAQPRGKLAPSQEVLATIPGLTQAQKDAIYRIETEKQAEHKALWEAERAAHREISEQTTAELRAALGDDAYATYAAWKLEQRADRKRGRPHRGGAHGGPDDAGDMSEPATEG